MTTATVTTATPDEDPTPLFSYRYAENGRPTKVEVYETYPGQYRVELSNRKLKHSLRVVPGGLLFILMRNHMKKLISMDIKGKTTPVFSKASYVATVTGLETNTPGEHILVVKNKTTGVSAAVPYKGNLYP